MLPCCEHRRTSNSQQQNLCYHAGQYAQVLNLTAVQNGTLNVGPGMANLTVRAVANCTVNNQYLLKVRASSMQCLETC